MIASAELLDRFKAVQQDVMGGCVQFDERGLDILSSYSGMPVPPEYRDGVLRQLRLNHDLAAPLLRFDLPGTELPAPVFRP